MKRQMIGVMIVAGMVICLPAAAQQKLGDVAGSIKLKKTGDEQVVISDSGVGKTTRRAAPSSDSELLSAVLDDCLTTARELLTFFQSSPRILPVTYSSEFEAQLGTYDRRLLDLTQELRMLPDAGPHEAAYSKAAGGMEGIRQGYDGAVEAVERYQLISAISMNQISTGITAIEGAVADIRSVERSQAAVAPPAAVDPIAAAASIQRLCSKQGAEGSPAYQDCVRKQESAKNAIISRTAPAVGLGTTEFNSIRNRCSFEWPDNYVNRDACELRNAASAARE